MNKKTVGIIGNGFVGESQAFAFSPTADIKIYDIDPLRSTHTLEETLNQEFIFVCIPTPMTMVLKIFPILKISSSRLPPMKIIFLLLNQQYSRVQPKS